MGFRAAVLLGFVLLLSDGSFCSAAQNWVIFGTNETLHQIKQEPVTTSSQQENQTKNSPVTYRLKTYQLRKTADGSDRQKLPLSVEQSVQTSQVVEAVHLTPELQGQRKPVHAEEVLLAPGPDPSMPASELVKKESKVVGKFDQRVPVPAASVSVRCGEEKVTIAVKQDFLGNGQLIRPSDLTLGGCMVVDSVDHILLFQTELHGCGSTKMMTEGSLIYTFSLMYSPTPIGNTSILKTNPVEVTVQCHFQRKHYVSSNAMRPAWTTFALKMQADQQLHFSLRLMSEDWLSYRPSNVYYLSDVMHIEASVLQGHHVPLRVFVDSCVATANPDSNSEPRYPFITNHGCLTDAKLSGAKSYFMPRSQEDKLYLQLEAFKFQQTDKNSVYITCHLKATTLTVPINSQLKVCSFLTETKRWVASGGENVVCSCCETSCGGQRQKRSPAADSGDSAPWWEGTAALGPIVLEDRILEEDLPPEPVPELQTQEDAQASASSSSIVLLCGAGAALAVVLVFMSTVICSRLHNPTGHSVCT